MSPDPATRPVTSRGQAFLVHPTRLTSSVSIARSPYRWMGAQVSVPVEVRFFDR